MNGSVEVVIEDLKNHPLCPHGPTILFSRLVDGKKRNYFACSACRDRKECSFFMWQDERAKTTNASKDAWEQERKKFLANINHRKMFLTLQEIKSLPEEKRIYCHTCSEFKFDKQGPEKHKGHDLFKKVSDYYLDHPSEFLRPLDDPKKEAQYLFSKSSVKAIVNILRELNFTDVLCIGTPRLHEYLSADCNDMNSLLLDIDCRFHQFFGPLQFCWYNLFNHHFFLSNAKRVFDDYLRTNGNRSLVLVTDPPFGGRTEILAFVFQQINNQYKLVNNLKNDLPIFWIYPYFNESHIQNSFPNFHMLDYKVNYDNHTVFQNTTDGGPKLGSPVRIFTNIEPHLITLPKEEGYKFCRNCRKWVANENKHCKVCDSCTSKDGRTYIHCKICKRCVKPTWRHCPDCNRCTQPEHECRQLKFEKECYHCKKMGHKKKDCPDLDKASTAGGQTNSKDDASKKKKKGTDSTPATGKPAKKQKVQ